MLAATTDLVLAFEDRCTLERMLRHTTPVRAIATRVRAVLALADGANSATVAARFACTDQLIAIWKHRFVEGGVLAMSDAQLAER